MKINFLKSVHRKQPSKAFTILEIMVVISVVAILIAVLIPKIKGMQDESKVNKAKTEVKTLMLALESYKMHSGLTTYPIKTGTNYTSLQADYLLSATPNIVGTKLYDPFASNSTTEYKYMSDSSGTYYIIWSVGLPGAIVPTSVSTDGTIGY